MREQKFEKVVEYEELNTHEESLVCWISGIILGVGIVLLVFGVMETIDYQYVYFGVAGVIGSVMIMNIKKRKVYWRKVKHGKL